MTDPLVVEFVVDVDPNHAFAMWTERIATWWPPDHTIGTNPVSIVVEARPGGRVFERGADGHEHDWATITGWDPPRRVSYRWHMFFEPAEATDLEVTFTADDTGTRVRITQTGWERLGDAGPGRRERTGVVWGAMADHFTTAAHGGR